MDCLEVSIGRELGSPAAGLRLQYLINSELIGVTYHEEKICFRAPNTVIMRPPFSDITEDRRWWNMITYVNENHNHLPCVPNCRHVVNVLLFIVISLTFLSFLNFCVESWWPLLSTWEGIKGLTLHLLTLIFFQTHRTFFWNV